MAMASLKNCLLFLSSLYQNTCHVVILCTLHVCCVIGSLRGAQSLPPDPTSMKRLSLLSLIIQQCLDCPIHLSLAVSSNLLTVTQLGGRGGSSSYALKITAFRTNLGILTCVVVKVLPIEHNQQNKQF